MISIIRELYVRWVEIDTRISGQAAHILPLLLPQSHP
jgi:hypothetical protein